MQIFVAAILFCAVLSFLAFCVIFSWVIFTSILSIISYFFLGSLLFIVLLWVVSSCTETVRRWLGFPSSSENDD